jgi:uncharacterized glyoxalase superfamily protein PhnB
VDYPTLCPYIYYQDLAAAMAFLEAAFGFRERMRTTNIDGSLGHCEMELGDAVVMLGSPPGLKSPAQLGQVTVGLYVNVPDVDAVCRRATAAGAAVDGPPVDQPYGARILAVHDPEGHRWWFSQALDPS